MNKIEYPPFWKTLLYIGATIATSQLVMYLDQARIMAYVIVPFLYFRKWCSASGITWRNNRKAAVISYVLGFAWFLLSYSIVAATISGELSSGL